MLIQTYQWCFWRAVMGEGFQKNTLHFGRSKRRIKSYGEGTNGLMGLIF